MPRSRRTPLSASSNEVADLYRGLVRILDDAGDDGRKVGDCKYGVYLFRDYDEEPIYVGQTYEVLRGRIRRHLTNQRTDAVAMNVLDPYEVDEIEMWPFWDWHQQYLNQTDDASRGLVNEQAKQMLDRAEFTVYNRALRESRFNAVLNPESTDGHGLRE